MTFKDTSTQVAFFKVSDAERLIEWLLDREEIALDSDGDWDYCVSDGAESGIGELDRNGTIDCCDPPIFTNFQLKDSVDLDEIIKAAQKIDPRCAFFSPDREGCIQKLCPDEVMRKYPIDYYRSLDIDEFHTELPIQTQQLFLKALKERSASCGWTYNVSVNAFSQREADEIIERLTLFGGHDAAVEDYTEPCYGITPAAPGVCLQIAVPDRLSPTEISSIIKDIQPCANFRILCDEVISERNYCKSPPSPQEYLELIDDRHLEAFCHLLGGELQKYALDLLTKRGISLGNPESRVQAVLDRRNPDASIRETVKEIRRLTDAYMPGDLEKVAAKYDIDLDRLTSPTDWQLWLDRIEVEEF